MTRRDMLGRGSLGLGAVAFASSMASPARATPLRPTFTPRAKRLIYLFQSGGPSQFETFDHKPALDKLHGTELPDSVRMGQVITGMTSIQASLPVARSIYRFRRRGQSGAEISELLPHIGGVADHLCIVRSMFTDSISHDPATTFMQTGSPIPGRPGMGAWLSYGLGSENADLPAFIVLVSEGTSKFAPQPLSPRLWASGFLPSQHQGVRLRSAGDPVLYLSNPPGVSDAAQRDSIDAIASLNRIAAERHGDAEITARVAQYELAYRMQASVPSLTDLSAEPDHVFDLYGPSSRRPGTYAHNCLLARRLAERGVRFIQLYHRGWDQHDALPRDLPLQCADVDQPTAALIRDLHQRGMLDDTLIVWGGEFGRTVYCQGPLTAQTYGRDHHPRSFMAGGGARPGVTHGATDDYGYNIVDRDRHGVHVHDLHATALHLLGIDHERLTFRTQGRDFRLTDVHGRVVAPLIA